MSGENKSRSVLSIPLDSIVQIENSRELYDREEMAELMTSMRTSGLLAPIGVRAKGSKWEVVYGNRRFISAKKLGWKTIEALVLENLEEQEDMLLTNAMENMQRCDVPPAEQGRIFAGLVKQQGLTSAEIAARVGISKQKVDSAIRLYQHVPPSMRKNITAGNTGATVKGHLSKAAANAVTGMIAAHGMNKAQAQEVFEACAKEGLPVERVRQAAALVRGGYTPKEAIKEAINTRVVTVSVPIPIDHVKRLQDEHGQKIHEIIYDFLAAERWLKVVRAPKK